MDPIYVRFWARKIEFWRRPGVLWCFTGYSFRDHSLLTTETKKNSFGAHFGAQKWPPKLLKKQSGGSSRAGPILGPVLRAPECSYRVGPAECAGPGGDYRGGAGSWLKVKVLSVEGFRKETDNGFRRKIQ